MRSIALIDYFKRWRHGRGFGIHSPFAFRFVNEVLKERNAYYAYHKIAKHFADHESAKCHALSFQSATCIFRVVNYFQPQCLMLTGEQDHALLRDIVRYASKSIRFTNTPSDADMIIVCGSAKGDEKAYMTLCKAVADNHSTVIFTSRLSADSAMLWQQICDSLSYGMAFVNTDSTPAILVANPKLPKQEFNVLF